MNLNELNMITVGMKMMRFTVLVIVAEMLNTVS